MKTKKAKKRSWRRGVGAVLFNGEGRVFVARRIDTPSVAWQMPQGGIRKGETPRRAVLRELAEEIGTDKVEIIGESAGWMCYDLPEDLSARVWGGRYRGQRQRWFALKFTGADGDIDLASGPHPEFSEWKWVNIDELPRLIVPFKRRLYEDIADAFRHLATAAGERMEGERRR